MLSDTLKDKELTLDEKLLLIDQAIQEATVNIKSFYTAPVDPADITMCQGCQ